MVNAAAGSVENEEPQAISSRVAEACRRAGLDAVVETVARDRLGAAVADAAASSADVVVVGGGDGTLSSALPPLVASGKPLGVLPLGTLNHFAHDLGLPTDLDAALGALAEARVREVDLGEINGRLFLNNCSLGLYPEVVRERENRQRAGGRRHWPAMMKAAWATLRRFPVVRVRLRAASRSWGLTTPFVFVGNNRYDTKLPAANRTALDHGELWIYVARKTSRLGLVGLVLRSMLGRLDGARDFECWAAPSLEIGSRQPWLRVAVDGEIAQLEAPLRCRIRPRALKVMVPAPA